uniref:Putative HNH endonuclease n=1 Tax=viral metagenome TaxID=1070528 RepID=A0A6M3JKU3_9ZZZZ
MKVCTKCKIEKESIEFCKRTASKDGLALVCRVCAKEFKKQYFLDPQKVKQNKETHRQWRKRNLKEKCEANKRWVANNLEKSREYQRIWAKKYRVNHKRNPDLDKERKRKWRVENPEKRKITQDKANTKTRSTLKGRLNGNIATAVGFSLRRGGGIKGGLKWENLVGFTIGDLKIHLEKQFNSQMSWENYGSYWWVDHKIPVAAFNFQTSKDIDFFRCWALENLQPLEKIENCRKNAKLNKPFQPSLLIAGE